MPLNSPSAQRQCVRLNAAGDSVSLLATSPAAAVLLVNAAAELEAALEAMRATDDQAAALALAAVLKHFEKSHAIHPHRHPPMSEADWANLGGLIVNKGGAGEPVTAREVPAGRGLNPRHLFCWPN